MKHFTAAVATVALSLALAGCSFNIKTDSAPTTSPTTTSPTTSTTTTSATTSAQAAGPNYTIADYIRDNHIQETPVHHGDPGSPTIDLPVPDDWRLLPESSRAPYGGIVYTQPADPNDPPTIVAILSKLTGDIDPAKVLQFAPGELKNLPGFQGSGDGSAATLGGFSAWQLGGSYSKNGKLRTVAQKTVVIPSQGAVFVLQLNAGLEHRVGGNAVAGDRPVGKVRGIAVHQDEIHLGMRNAHRLQHIFDRLMAAERPAHRQTARLQLHELVELGVCPDIHIADHSLSSPAGSREGNGVRAPGRDRLEDLQYRRGASTVEVWPFARVDGNRGCTVDSSFA